MSRRIPILFSTLAIVAALAYFWSSMISVQTESDLPEFDFVGLSPPNDSILLHARTLYAQNAQTAMDSASDASELFALFQHYLQQAPDSLAWPALFDYTLHHPLLNDGEPHPEFAKLWASAARATKSLSLRSLYNSHYSLAWSAVLDTFNFSIASHSWRPGDTLSYKYRGDYGHSPAPVVVEIARIGLDESFYPGNAQILDTVTFTQVAGKNDALLGPALTEPGIYRLNILHNEVFQEDLIRVTNLEMAIQQDSTTFLVWGSSFKNQSPPPYRIHWQKVDGSWISMPTDSSGLLAVRTRQQLEPGQNLRIILTAPGEAPVFGSWTEPTKPYPESPRPFLWTDRPRYQQEATLHLRGIYWGADSASLSVYNSSNVKTYSRHLGVNGYGHFGDSLNLENETKQGIFRIQLDSIHSPSGWQTPTNPMATYALATGQTPPPVQLSLGSHPAFVLQGDTLRIPVHAQTQDGRPWGKRLIGVRWLYSSSYWEDGIQISREYRYLQRQDTLLLDKQGLACTATPADFNQHMSGELLAEFFTLDNNTPTSIARTTLRYVIQNAYFNTYQLSDLPGDSILIQGYWLDALERPQRKPILLTLSQASRSVSQARIIPGSDGSYTHAFPRSAAGEYQLTATANSTHGTLLVEQNLSIPPPTEMQQSWSKVEIYPNRTHFRSGDTAQIKVRSGATNAHALLLATGQRLHSWKSTYLQNGMLSTKIPLSPQMGSSLRFSMLYVNENAMLHGFSQLPITDSTDLLHAQVDMPATVQAGTRLSLPVRITSADSKPASCEFSVALYDEAENEDAQRSALNDGTTQPHANAWKQAKQRKTPMIELPRFGLSTLDPWGIYTKRLREKSIQNIDTNIVCCQANGYVSNYRVQCFPRTQRPATPPETINDILNYVRKRSLNPLKYLRDSYTRHHSSTTFSWNAANYYGLVSEPYSEELQGLSYSQGLAFWKASVRTDNRGRATLDIPLPQRPGRWHLQLTGSDGSSRLLDYSNVIQVLPGLQ